MLVGNLISGVVAGALSLLAALAFEVGPTLAVLGYVVGGVCGCLVFAGLVGGRRDLDHG